MDGHAPLNPPRDGAAPPPRWEWWALGALSAVFLARVLAWWRYVPIWDSHVYANCVIWSWHAKQPDWLNCAEHPSAGYLAVVELSQLFTPDHYGGVILVNGLLAVGALLAFAFLLRRLDPRPKAALPRVAAVAALSTHPLLLATTIGLTPDFGMTVFFIFVLAALLARRFVLAACAGALLVLTKEPGIGLYVLAVASYAVLFLPGERWWKRLSALRRHPILALPLLGLADFPSLWVPGSMGTLWYGQSTGSVAVSLFKPTFNLTQTVDLFWILSAQFNWVALVVMLSGAVLKLRRTRRWPARGTLWLLALFLVTAYALTRYSTYLNPRYFLVLAPLFVGLLYLAAFPSWGSPRWAGALLGAIALLFCLESVRTVDPVTRRLFGTFPFGTHRMLMATSLTGECCGYGRDQLAYNLEHLHLATLEDQVFPLLRPTPQTVLVADPNADWFLVGGVDEQFHRVLTGGTTLKLHRADEILAEHPLPERIYFLAYPNFPNDDEIEKLLTAYRLRGAQTVDEDGYGMNVFALDRK